MPIQSINPFTEEILGEFKAMTFDEVKNQIKNSQNAFKGWSNLSIEKRCEYIKNVGVQLRKNAQEYAKIITQEMGKPIKESLAEIEKCAWGCDYYSENGSKFLADEDIPTEAKKSYISFEPLGVILGIMPWNFPFWQVFRFAVPALIAGNVCVLKHASNVPLSALAIEKVFHDAGVPSDVFKTLLIDSSTAMAVIENELVQGISLTGSEKAGSEVGSLAGKKIRKIVLELGGSDPFIILDDADVEKAAEIAVKTRLINNGQSCIAAKRFIVMKSVASQFTQKFIENCQKLKMGDPMDMETDLGPLAKKEFVTSLQKQLDEAKKSGAEIILVGTPPLISTQKGYFFQPAVITNATAQMNVCREETFGPIAPIITVENDEEAIRIANDTTFGLGAAIWSKDLKKAEKLAKKIEAGFVVINDMVKSDPRLPFGGIKKSGVGRELSHYGLKEFVNIKTIVVKA